VPFDLHLNLSQIGSYSRAIAGCGTLRRWSGYAQGSAGSGAASSNSRRSTTECRRGAGPTAGSDSRAVRSIMISGSGGNGGVFGLAWSTNGGAGRRPMMAGAPSGAADGTSRKRVTSPPIGPCPLSPGCESGFCRRKRLEGRLATCTWRFDDRTIAPIPTAHTATIDHTRQSVTTPIACDRRPLTTPSSGVCVSALRQLLHHVTEHIEDNRAVPVPSTREKPPRT
jgi:hypothetical protein